MANFTSDLAQLFPVASNDPRKILSQLVWSRQVHSLIRRKMVFSRFTGRPITGEDNLERVVTGAPIVEYGEFGANRGDQMLIPIKGPISYNPLNTGVVGAEILTGTEKKLRYGYTRLFIEEARNATIVENVKMQQQRTALDLVRDAQNELADWGFQYMDNSILYSLYYGWSPNVMRSADITGGSLYTSPVAPTVHPNVLHYVGGTAPTLVAGAQTVTQIAATGTYTMDGYTLQNNTYNTPDRYLIESLAAYLNAAGIPAYRAEKEGMDVYVAVCHPYQVAHMRLNSEFFAAMANALPRGSDNPIFTGAFGMWANIVFHETPKGIFDPPNSLAQTATASSSVATEFPVFANTNNYLTLTESKKWDNAGTPTALTYYNNADTAHSNLAFFDPYKNTTTGYAGYVDNTTASSRVWGVAPMYILGANAVATAFAKSGMGRLSSYWDFVPRETSDYRKFAGFGISGVNGARRIDWKYPDSTFTNDQIFNQSSLMVFTGIGIFVKAISGVDFNLPNDLSVTTTAISSSADNA